MDTGSLLTESGRAKSQKEGSGIKKLPRSSGAIPPAFFLILAGSAMAFSLGLATSRKKRRWASFVGQWVPTLLLLGIYDKVIKTQKAEGDEKKSPLLH